MEYGRKSGKRGDAPTLIPVEEGGSQVNATLLLISDELSGEEIQHMLYRRELDKVGDTNKKYPFGRSGKNVDHCIIQQHSNIANVETVFTANFGCNLPDGYTASDLADLAIDSFNDESVCMVRNGISYLKNNIDNGIITPMTEEYKNEILRKLDKESLEEILEEG